MEAFLFGDIVTLRKGNHSGEAQVRIGQRKALYKRERNSLEGSHEEAEIQRKAWKEFNLQRRYMFGKRKSAVDGYPKKSWSWIETEAGAE